MYVSVKLSKFGFPSHGWHDDTVESDFALVLTVGRVGLLMRFIRTFARFHNLGSARLLHAFHHMNWFQKLQRLSQGEGSEKQAMPASQRHLDSSSTWGERSRRDFG